MVRRSMSLRSSRVFSGSIAAASRPAPKRGASSNKPEKHGLARRAERPRFVGRKQRIERRALRFEHDQLAADDIEAGALVREQRRELRLVAAQRGGALEQAAGIGLARQ